MWKAWNKIDTNLAPENIKNWVSIFWVEWEYISQPDDDDFIRPIEWLPLSILSPTEQKIEILTFVTDTDSNFVAFLCAGGYTVDWGDWVIENIASSVKAQHTYTYSNTYLNSDTVAKYWYKQCIITITPQAWQNLTSANFDQYHSSIGSGTSYDKSVPFLDINIAWPNITNLTLGKTTQTYVLFNNVQKIRIESLNDAFLSSLCKNFASLQYFYLWISNAYDMREIFYNCRSLCTVILLDTSSVEYMDNMFFSCTALSKIPFFDTSSVIFMTEMFRGCSNITTIPFFDTSSAQYMDGLFMSCYRITIVPTLDTSSVITMSEMFYNCSSLGAIPLLDTSSVTDMSYMFSICYQLISIPLLDTSSVTNMESAFSSCASLAEAPLLDTSSVTNMYLLFFQCWSLIRVPLLDTSSVTSMNQMFSNCFALSNIPLFDTSSVRNMQSFFNQCYSVTAMPPLNITAITADPALFWELCWSLKRMTAPLKYSFTLLNASMSSAALNEMYTALPTVTGKTVTVTGNYWVSWDTPSIATAKGWTVTG